MRKTHSRARNVTAQWKSFKESTAAWGQRWENGTDRMPEVSKVTCPSLYLLLTVPDSGIYIKGEAIQKGHRSFFPVG